MSRPIETAEWDGDDLVITGILDDGSVDSDGQRCDPAWLHRAAEYWLEHWPNIRVGPDRQVVGIGTAVWADGDTTRIRARIQVGHVARLIVNKIITEFTFGITRPVIHSDSQAPMGVIVRGTLVDVGFPEPVIRAAGRDIPLVSPDGQEYAPPL